MNFKKILMFLALIMLFSILSYASPENILKDINKKLNQSLLIYDTSGDNLIRVDFFKNKAQVKFITLEKKGYLISYYKKQKHIKIIGSLDDDLVLSSDGSLRYYLKSKWYMESSRIENDVYVENIETGENRQLNRRYLFNEQLSISPDGKFLAFYCSDDIYAEAKRNYGLCVIPTDGSAEEIQIAPPSIITYRVEFPDAPLWTKTGKYLYFALTYSEGEKGGYRILDLERKRYTDNSLFEGINQIMNISYDGEKLFLMKSQSDRSIYSANLGGSDLEILIASIQNPSIQFKYDYPCLPSPSLDGKFIAYQTINGIFICRNDGSDITKVTDNPEFGPISIYWLTDEPEKYNAIQSQMKYDDSILDDLFEKMNRPAEGVVTPGHTKPVSKITWYIAAGVTIILIAIVIILVRKQRRLKK